MSASPVLTSLALVAGRLRRNTSFVSIWEERKKEGLSWLGMRLWGQQPQSPLSHANVNRSGFFFWCTFMWRLRMCEGSASCSFTKQGNCKLKLCQGVDNLCLCVYVFKTLSIQTLRVAAFTNKVVFQKASCTVKDSCLAIYGYLDISKIGSEFSERHSRDTGESWGMLFSRGGRTYAMLICTPLKTALTNWNIFMGEMRAVRSASLSVLPLPAQPVNLLLLLLGKARGSQIITQVKERRHAENCQRRKDWGKKRLELLESDVAVQRALNFDFTTCASYDASVSQSLYSCFKKVWGSRKSRKKAMTENDIAIWDSGSIINQHFKTKFCSECTSFAQICFSTVYIFMYIRASSQGDT